MHNDKSFSCHVFWEGSEVVKKNTKYHAFLSLSKNMKRPLIGFRFSYKVTGNAIFSGSSI